MKVRDAIKLIEKDGWRIKRTRGDHRVYAHPIKPGIVVVPGHLGADLALGTLSSILKQAGLK
jgi:predicted RNA binding protein YcfA (HicA-like mRNA interferase family)